MQKKQIVIMAFAGLVLGNLVFGILMLVRGRHETPDTRLGGEQLAIAKLADVHYLFFAPGSHDDLQAARPDIVSAGDERAFAQGMQMPETFRLLDHKKQFDALLLSGDPTTYKPLLRHLGETKDFVLTWLDNADLIFRRRGATPWKEADLDATAAQFTGESKARFLSGAAARLIAIGQMQMARRALDAAGPNGKNLPEYWTSLALYDGDVAHWEDALAAVNKALTIQPDDTAAMTTKAVIFFGARRFEEAMAISDQVVQAHPDDPSMLFLHATICHQAHAYDREIAVLNHLIDLADKQGESTTGYRIYLGQSYAEHGDAMNSLMQFQAALNSPDLSQSQRDFAQDCVAKIRDKVAGNGQ